MDLETAAKIAQIAAPVAVTFSALIALWLGLRNREPRFQAWIGVRDGIVLDIRNHGTLPVRIKGLAVAGFKTIPGWRKYERVFKFRSMIWVVEAGDEKTANLRELLTENENILWLAWAMSEPNWSRYSVRLARLAQRWCHIAVITTDGRRTRARMTDEAVLAFHAKRGDGERSTR